MFDDENDVLKMFNATQDNIDWSRHGPWRIEVGSSRCAASHFVYFYACVVVWRIHVRDGPSGAGER